MNTLSQYSQIRTELPCTLQFRGEPAMGTVREVEVRSQRQALCGLSLLVNWASGILPDGLETRLRVTFNPGTEDALSEEFYVRRHCLNFEEAGSVGDMEITLGPDITLGELARVGRFCRLAEAMAQGQVQAAIEITAIARR